MNAKLVLAAALLAGAAALPAAAFAEEPQPWTGFHVGLNGGYGGNHFEYPFTASGTSGSTSLAASGSAKLNSSGFLGGGQIGYDYETAGGMLLGAEADIDVTDIQGRVSASGALTGTSAGTASGNIGSKIEYLGTVRARAGFALDKAAVYATGGLAFGDVKSSYVVNVASGGSTLLSAAGSKTFTHTGWTVGAGVEYPIFDRLTFKTEYLYADLGEHTALSGPFSIANATGSGVLKVKSTANIVRIGLNYHF